VDFNLFRKYNKLLTQFTEFDPRSIMLYAIPNNLTIGDFEVGWNRELSDMDKAFIGAMYPFEIKPSVALTVGGPAVEAAIGKHGEEDLFNFSVTAPGQVAVETEGQTDVVMTLLGPNSQQHVVAEDDDSGQGANAQIRASLEAGTYYVRVRHFRPTGMGQYRIGVRAGS
jgi:hypothetical protein